MISFAIITVRSAFLSDKILEETGQLNVVSLGIEAADCPVYPNPLNGAMLLHTGEEMPAGSTWVLYDFTGKLIGTGNVNADADAIGAHLKNAGLYLIEFRSKSGRSLGGATLKN